MRFLIFLAPMNCKSIGQANPDIAGIGVGPALLKLKLHTLTCKSQILVAFVVQSLIAVIVSFYAWILSSMIQERWNDADPNPQEY